MEMPKRNSPCSSLKQAHFFFFFSYTKSENGRAEQVLPWGRVVPVGERGGGEIVMEDE
jgi:hypothetical protein